MRVFNKVTDPAPLGLVPRFILAENRVVDIDEAIKRYLSAYKEIPAEWIEERNELIRYLAHRRP